MKLCERSKEKLRDLIDEKMRLLLDWTDFIEDAGMSIADVDGYLNCERDTIAEEQLQGIARALGTRYEALRCLLMEEIPAREQPAEEESFDDPYNALWDQFEAAEDENARGELAALLADKIEQLGMLHYEHYDFLELCGTYNDAHSLAATIPESAEAALVCVKLATGVFELKFRFQEFENVESYIDELIPVTGRFPDDEEFASRSAACLCNLLQLCPYDMGVFYSRMREVLDRIEELAGRFPENAGLQLCYLRSITFLICYGKPRLIDEAYDKLFKQTKDAFDARQGIVAESDFSEMRDVLWQNGIIL